MSHFIYLCCLCSMTLWAHSWQGAHMWQISANLKDCMWQNLKNTNYFYFCKYCQIMNKNIYRPVSILSSLEKYSQSLFHNRQIKFIYKTNIIGICQTQNTVFLYSELLDKVYQPVIVKQALNFQNPKILFDSSYILISQRNAKIKNIKWHIYYIFLQHLADFQVACGRSLVFI